MSFGWVSGKGYPVYRKKGCRERLPGFINEKDVFMDQIIASVFSYHCRRDGGQSNVETQEHEFVQDYVHSPKADGDPWWSFPPLRSSVVQVVVCMFVIDMSARTGGRVHSSYDQDDQDVPYSLGSVSMKDSEHACMHWPLSER